jgi:hypothetical protein
MMNNSPAQLSQNSFYRRFHTPNGQQPRSGVGQDNPTPPRERAASHQPVTVTPPPRTQKVDTKHSRIQKRSSTKRKTVPVMMWVNPVVKAELARIAEQEGLSMSATGAALLEYAIRQDIHTQHGVLLDTIIEKAIAKHMRSYSSRIAVLLVRSIFASEQTRSLTTNILGRQPGVTQSLLTEILNGSSRSAKRNITHVTPQLKDLIDAVERWIQEREDTNA